MEITNKHLHPIRKRISVVCGSFLPCQGWLPITSNTKCNRTPPPTKQERLSYLQPKKTFSNWNLVLRSSLQAVYLTKVLPFQLWEQCKTLTIPVVKGIIAPVPVGTAVEWCSPMVFVCKKDETPCLTVDLQKLNAQCFTEPCHCLTTFQLAFQVLQNVKKTLLML